MKAAYWLLDGIRSIVSSFENELKTSDTVEQLLNKPRPDTQQEGADKPIQSNEA